MSTPTAHGAVERLRQSRAVADREDHGRPMPERRRRPNPLHAIPISPKTCIKSPIQRPRHPSAPAPQLYSPSASVASRPAGVQTPSTPSPSRGRPAPSPVQPPHHPSPSPRCSAARALQSPCARSRGEELPATSLSSAGSASAASCPKQR